ncbi:glycoprotein X [Phlyctema vagabunda]|uniref:Glycoprotein X n=1 Tax=Phlyctema vagabunda TaxID=108571 RepID=A0ABR4P3U5_9HELO
MQLFRYVSAILTRRDDIIVPPVCYVGCNDMFIEAQKAGLSPESCASNSSFRISLEACSTCIETQGVTTIATDSESKFEQFLQFCNNTDIAQRASQMASLQSQASAMGKTVVDVSDLQYSYATTSVLSSNRSDQSYQITTVYATATPTAPPASLQTTVPQPPWRDKTWIAGAVIGPTTALILIVLLWWWHRKRKRAGLQPDYIVVADQLSDKAQLHSESVAPKQIYELKGSDFQERVELPALELVGSELDVPSAKPRHTVADGQ